MVGLPSSLCGGRYRLERVLGRGGMATVALGHDRELERPVAVKILAENLAADASIRERFLREAVIAARLQHPNVVQVYDSGEDGRPYMVMEYVEGETLAEELRDRGRLGWREAAEAAVQACAGLEHAHAKGVVHRDVKPQNLIRAADGPVKLVDFGIAYLAEGTRLTEAGMLMGTAPYVAPEVLAGERTITGAVDVYGLGVVLYELVCGRKPLPSESLAALVEAQRGDEVAPPSAFAEMPLGMEAAILACLAAEPGERPPSAASLARSLVTAAPRWTGEEPPPETGVRATEVTVRLPGTEGPPTITPARDRPPSGVRVKPVHALAAVAALGALAALAVLTTGNDPGQGVPEPEPVPRVDDAADQARTISDWIEQRTR
jgi:serine/threonine protein kinase